MVQLPLETSKHSGKQYRLGMAQLPGTQRGTPSSVGRGPLVLIFFFLISIKKKKKVPEFGERTTVEMQAEMEMKEQVGKMSKNN